MPRAFSKLLVAGLLLFAACPAFAAEPVLQVVALWDVGSLEPSRAGYVFTRLQVAETLVTAAPDRSLTPGLAMLKPDTEPNVLVLRPLPHPKPKASGMPHLRGHTRP